MGKTLAKLKKQAKRIKRDLFVLVEAYNHPRAPLFVKLLSIIIVAYAFSPIDLIPDFIPVFGYLDDIILIPLAISFVVKMIPKDVLFECREIVESSENVKKKNWIAGIMILLLWTGIILWIAWAIFKNVK